MELVKTAKVRAEQQAAARVTMLDLARELLEGASEREAMERLLAEEQERSRKLQLQLQAALDREEKALEELDNLKCRNYRNMFEKSVFNGGLTSTMMLWSRRAAPVDCLSDSPSRPSTGIMSSTAASGFKAPATAPAESMAMSTQETPHFPDPDADPDVTTTTRELAFDTTNIEGMQRPSPSRKRSDSCKSFKSTLTWKEDLVEEIDMDRQLEVPGMRSKGDGLTLLWIFRAWKNFTIEAERHREDSEPQVIIQPDLEALEKLKNSYEKLLAEERAKTRALERKLQALMDELEALKQSVERLEAEKADLTKQLKPKTSGELTYEELERLCEDLRQQIESKDKEISTLKQVIKDLEARLIEEREKAEAEYARLKAQIRDISAELERQILFAKHLRDLALKAKRDAAMSISPEKFAQLIAEMESMRDKMTVLGAEHNREYHQASLLKMKLDMNRRQLELERQFLPLLHKVRGPVGPKNPLFNKNMQQLAAINLSAETGGQPEKLRMAHSQSAGALPDPRGGGRSLGRPTGTPK